MIPLDFELMDVTYAELATVLKQLNFEDKSTTKVFRFVNESFDAEVFIQLGDANSLVQKANYQAITFILTAKGVFDKRSDLNALIEKNRQQLTQSKSLL